MQVQETTTFTRVVASAVAAYLTVTKPNGEVDQDLLATVSPEGSQFKISIDYTPVMGGNHKAVWKWITSDNSIKTYPFTFVATWNSVYPAVRTLLGTGELTPSDITLDKYFNDIYTQLKVFSNMPDYWAFSTSYQDAYDAGISYLIASKVRPAIGSKSPTGEMLLFKKGTTTLQFASSPKSTVVQSLEQQWWDFGLSLIMATITEYANAYVNDQSQDITMTRGPLSPNNRHKTFTLPDGTGYYPGDHGEM